MAELTGAAAAAPLVLNGGFPWHPDLKREADTLLNDMADVPPGAFTRAVWAEVSGRIDGMLAGIRAYQSHTVERDLDPPPVVWQSGAARLFDFGGIGRPALMVPSLVNGSEVLDLDRDGSLCRWLSAQGVVRPFLLDWGPPGEAESGYGLTDYVIGPLYAALQHVRGEAGGPVHLLGYCMGGTLVAAAAQLWPDDVRSLALLAAPWDFHADIAAPARQFAEAMPTWRPVLDAYGEMPVDLMQSFFAALDPGLAQRKFARFATLPPDGEAARRFVLLEDWLNAGPPLTPRVAMETIGGWFGDNNPAAGRWLIDGQVVDPARIACPVFVAAPRQDRIVPPASALALAERLGQPTVIQPDAGHIGMVVGSSALARLWTPLNDWFGSLI